MRRKIRMCLGFSPIWRFFRVHQEKRSGANNQNTTQDRLRFFLMIFFNFREKIGRLRPKFFGFLGVLKRKKIGGFGAEGADFF